jgi:arylsulfatase
VAHHRSNSLILDLDAILRSFCHRLSRESASNYIDQNKLFTKAKKKMDRNVLLVTFDSLRADHCGHWGYDRETTPTLDRLARDGISFESAIAPGPNTFESMPVIMTGEYPAPISDADFGDGFDARRSRISRHMDARMPLAERFRKRGYSTAAFTPNPFTSKKFGFDKGFDDFEDFIESEDDRFDSGLVSNSYLLNVLYNWKRGEREFRPWESFYDQIMSWIESTSEPYFVWILLMDTHNPFLIPSSHHKFSSKAWELLANWRKVWRDTPVEQFIDLETRLVDLYDDSIRYTDAFLDRLTDDVDSGTTLAVHADHGEAFGEHGVYGHLAPHYLYEENVHVPMVLSNVDSSTTVSEPFSLRHVPELLLTAADSDADLGAFLDDHRDQTTVSRTRVGGRVAVRSDTEKLIIDGSETRLFDLASDPKEQQALPPVDASDDVDTLISDRDRFLSFQREKQRIGQEAESIDAV